MKRRDSPSGAYFVRQRHIVVIIPPFPLMIDGLLRLRFHLLLLLHFHRCNFLGFRGIENRKNCCETMCNNTSGGGTNITSGWKSSTCVMINSVQSNSAIGVALEEFDHACGYAGVGTTAASSHKKAHVHHRRHYPSTLKDKFLCFFGC